MPRFEVFCPAAPPAVPEDVTLRVDAEHWLAALKAGLQKIGGEQMAANVLCDVQADGSIHVSDPAEGGVFRIRELRAEAPTPARSGPAEAPGGAPARIGRPHAATPTADDVLARLFEEVAALAGLDRRAGLELVLDLAMREVDAEAGSVLLARPGGDELEFAVARGPRAKELAALRPAVPAGAGIVGFCVREDVSLAVSDAAKDPRFFRAVSEAIGYETRSLLCAPVSRRGQVLGALEVLNKRGGTPFAQQDLAVMYYLAHQAAEHLRRTGG